PGWKLRAFLTAKSTCNAGLRSRMIGEIKSASSRNWAFSNRRRKIILDRNKEKERCAMESNKKRNWIFGGFSLIILLLEYFICRYLFFDLHGMREFPQLLLLV